MESIKDEPVTPSGRLFVQPQLDLTINCAVGFKNPLDIEAIKTTFINCFIMKHPRFSSLLIVDKNGREFWRKTQVNFDDHFIVHQPKNPNNLDQINEEQQEEKVNAMLADFAVSSPLSKEKPLWEMHIISELKCFIFRIHHALGDGTTVMSLYLASCKRCDGKDENISEKNNKKNWRNKGCLNKGLLNRVWWTSVSLMGLTGKLLCMRDKKTVISGGEGVELWPRTVATAKFSLEDMKIVKRAIPGVTINDVLFGILSLGFSKYLDLRSSDALQKGVKITGLAMVNLRKQPGLQEISKFKEDDFQKAIWGNQFGFIMLPVYCYNNVEDPLNHVKRAKVMIDRKKQSLEAPFSYYSAKLTMSLFGPKAALKLNYKILCNTTFMISNVIGPQHESSFADNPMTYIRPTASSMPQAVTMHMTTYGGMANIQVLVAKEIIPDPQVLAKFFEDAMLEIKNAAIK